jgi:hypothetical protein
MLTQHGHLGNEVAVLIYGLPVLAIILCLVRWP